ncbi:MAG: hypothetical protein JWP87_4168 [Labilithrix sp.]|jgi:hypothetical protein|nr:hypothetical protein [Labilithrix sp.]
MHKKHLLVVAAALSAVAAGTAVAAPPSGELKPGPSVVRPQRVTWSCPAMIAPDAMTVQTDWTLFAPQGWLDHAEITKGDSQSMLRCYYGIDKASPAGRPAFYVHRVIPATFANCAIDGAKTSMSCDAR